MYDSSLIVLVLFMMFLKVKLLIEKNTDNKNLPIPEKPSSVVVDFKHPWPVSHVMLGGVSLSSLHMPHWLVLIHHRVRQLL